MDRLGCELEQTEAGVLTYMPLETLLHCVRTSFTLREFEFFVLRSLSEVCVSEELLLLFIMNSRRFRISFYGKEISTKKKVFVL